MIRVESAAEHDAVLKTHHVWVTHADSSGKAWEEEPWLRFFLYVVDRSEIHCLLSFPCILCPYVISGQ